MRKLNAFVVTVVINNQHRWDRRFIGRPNAEEVVEALQIDKTHLEGKESLEKYDQLLEMVQRYGLPLDTDYDMRCEFVGVSVGYIRITRSEFVYLSERVEGGLPLFEQPCQVE